MRRKDLLFAGLLLVAFLIFWWPAYLPGNVFFIRDLSMFAVDRNWFWKNSCGQWLWNPYNFLGMPDAANPQAEAFYPLNFWYLFMGPERGLVFYIISHHLLLLLTGYAAMRRIGFSAEASLAGATGFGFGGFICSLTNLITLLSAAAWLPLLIILLNDAVRRHWLRSTLLLGLVIAMQILAGEIEIAALTWLIAVCAVMLSPVSKNIREGWGRLIGSFAAASLIAVILTLYQTAITLQMVPLSNRGSGFGLTQALLWSLEARNLKSFFLPNYFLPASSGVYWGLGLFNRLPFIMSEYLGMTLLALALLAARTRKKFMALAWLMIALAGVAIAMGKTFPAYSFLLRYLPFFDLFRIPEKFLVLTAFGAAMLGAFGCEALQSRPISSVKAAALTAFCGLVIAALLVIFPLRLSEFSNQYDYIQQYLMLRSAFRVGAILLTALAIIFFIDRRNQNWTCPALAVAIFLDLFFAHHLIDPTAGLEFYQPGAAIRELRMQEKSRDYPIRIQSLKTPRAGVALNEPMDPVKFFSGEKNLLRPFWGMYFGINDIQAAPTLHTSDYDRFARLLEPLPQERAKIILARAGVEYAFRPESGFDKIDGAFPRASVYYQAKPVLDREKMETEWSNPAFPAQHLLLVEGKVEEKEPGQPALNSDPARIEKYANQEVVISAEAKKDGWLLLLDSYYPGWKAEVDGRQAEIYRADGFFRAVPLPAGKHVVTFTYFPKLFRRALAASAMGAVIWVVIFIISFRKRPAAEASTGN